MGNRVIVVSLGDSIATGTLTPFSRIDSFVFYLRQKFRATGRQPEFYSLACDGDTSQDLLWKLRNLRAFRATIKKADFITVSIGGNDLMKAGSIPGFTNINAKEARRRTEGFLRCWPQIAQELRSLNQAADIAVLSVYNPYNRTEYLGRQYSHDRNLFEITDGFLNQINKELWACSQANYKVADVYERFQQYSKGKMRRVSCLYPASFLRNPHPTPEGQRIIAGLIWEQFGL